jgi:predicted DCC family thiol-disulfide oxidoreductase YuxK
MQDIILYSNHCPLCKGLEKQLNNKHIEYTLCTDKEHMKELGLSHMPMLSVDGQLMSNKDALRWVLSQEQ